MGSHWGDLVWTLVKSGLPNFQKKGKLGYKELLNRAETLGIDEQIDYLLEYLRGSCGDVLVLEKSAQDSPDLQMQFLACDI